MQYLKENLSLIIFAFSLIAAIIKQRINETKTNMKMIELEKDLGELKQQRTEDREMINKLYSMLAEIKGQQTTEFRHINETLARHERK